MKRRSFACLLIAGILLTVSACALFAGEGTATKLVSNVRVNDIANTDTYTTRDMSVDETNGDIYISITGSILANSRIVKVDTNGANRVEFGPTLKYADGTSAFGFADQNPVSLAYNQLWGCAIDPQTRYLFVTGDVATDTVKIGKVFIVDLGLNGGFKTAPTDPLQNHVVLASFDVPNFITARGCAFDTLGNKFVTAGYIEQQRGKSGAKLFTRNDNSTPADPTDDTWTAAADLTQNGSWNGLGSYLGYIDSPRDANFDPNGDIFIAGADSFAYKYSGTAPYGFKGNLLYNDRGGADRWTVFCDDAEPFNVYTSGNYDSGGSGGIGYNVWGMNQKGLRTFKYGPFADFPLDSIKYCYFAIFDKGRDKLIWSGRDGVPAHSYLDILTIGHASPQYVCNITVNVKDSVTSANIAGAVVGIADINYNNSTFGTTCKGGGSWTTDASGNSPAVPLTNANLTYNVEVSAPGYISKRLWTNLVGENDITLNVTVDPVSSTNALTFTAPAFTDTKTRVQGTENGLFLYINDQGGRSTFATDPALSGTPIVEVGTRFGVTSGYFGADATHDNYMNMDICDNWLSSPTTLWITVEYLDRSPTSSDTDGFEIDGDFSAINPLDYAKPFGNVWKWAPDDNIFKTVTFKAVNISCKGQIRGFKNDFVVGADFRIDGQKYVNLVDGTVIEQATHGADYIKSITVSKVAPTPPAGTYTSIKTAKAAIVSDPVIMSDQIMTSQWSGNAFYIEDTARTNGLKISMGTGGMPSMASLISYPVSFAGTMQVDATGEPYILADVFSYDPTATATEIRPLGVVGRTINNLAGLPGMTGLRVKATGKVASIVPAVPATSDGSFTIDDGSGAVKVVIDKNMTLDLPVAGNYVSVDGIASLNGTAPSAVRAIKPWYTAVGLTNGDFETGLLAPFVTQGTGPGSYEISIDNPHNGTYSNHLSRTVAFDGSWWQIYRDDPGILVPGAWYEISLWVRGAITGDYVEFNINGSGDGEPTHRTVFNLLPSQLNADPAIWTKITNTFQATGWISTGLRTAIGLTYPADIYVDDIQVRLVGGGGGGAIRVY